jgi:type 1 glutamine amidotransferase
MNMKRIPMPELAILVLTAAAFWSSPTPTSRAAEAGKTRILLVTGGHDYETNQFVKLFRDNPNLTVLTAAHPKAHDWLKADAASQYDVLVFYDMWQDISEEAKANLVARLKEGKGLVALHHCLGSYQQWPEYALIIGGKYHLEKHVENGVEKPASTYKHDVDFKVQVADSGHPVTKGLKDFEIHDETYGRFEVRPEAHVLLTTDEPTSTRSIAWAKTYAAARVVYLQLGHDHVAYANPNYQRLVAQAIRWAAKQD